MKDHIGLLKIDHHEALFYILGGLEEGKTWKDIPSDPRLRRWHMHHKKSLKLKGQNNPEDHKFFKEIISEIRDCKSIILVGHGKGKSNEAESFHKYMIEHHKDLKELVIAILNEDNHETEKQMLAEADAIIGEKHFGHHNHKE
ncbi:hypothetical protein K4L44_04790 [Halosquirtibacter laminarini]|uniref:Uncharacterized protein n=1 Tax=Halosquirtibacter laminarini TaxID=3374600 RepID=A0AC61NNT7_9BACT|nr:hypothetical protein K4L44_04790 [Prolixibacteraceae bacterium]